MSFDLGDVKVSSIDGKISASRHVILTVEQNGKVLFDRLSVLVHRVHKYPEGRDGVHFVGVIDDVSRAKIARHIPNSNHTLPFFCEVWTHPDTGVNEISIGLERYENTRRMTV